MAAELEAIECVEQDAVGAMWRQYIAEMVPFYCSLLGRFCGAMLKYDAGHPLKQLCVLKVFHLYRLDTVRDAIDSAERTLFDPQPAPFNGYGHGVHSEQQRLIQSISNITLRPITEFERCPLPRCDAANTATPQTAQKQPTAAQLLYLKLQRSLIRMQAAPSTPPPDRQREEVPDGQPDGAESDHSVAGTLCNALCGALQFVLSLFWAQSRSDGGDGGFGSVSSVSECSYFAVPSDNVLFLRRIISEMEVLFELGHREQEQLLNQTIMYEPSQSAMMALTLPTGQPQAPPIGTRESVGRTVWDRPQGEWEWIWALRFHRMIYDVVILKTDSGSRRFYWKYLSSFHRIYGADVRAIGWYILLFVAFRYFWSWLFMLCLALFVAQFVRSVVTHWD